MICLDQGGQGGNESQADHTILRESSKGCPWHAQETDQEANQGRQSRDRESLT